MLGRIFQAIGIATILIAVWVFGALWAIDQMLDEYDSMQMLLHACQQEIRL